MCMHPPPTELLLRAHRHRLLDPVPNKCGQLSFRQDGPERRVPGLETCAIRERTEDERVESQLVEELSNGLDAVVVTSDGDGLAAFGARGVEIRPPDRGNPCGSAP